MLPLSCLLPPHHLPRKCMYVYGIHVLILPPLDSLTRNKKDRIKVKRKKRKEAHFIALDTVSEGNMKAGERN